MTLPPVHRSPKGVTLIEVCVVTAILGILMVSLLFAINKVVQNSKDARCIANLRQYYPALMRYASEHKGALPDYKEWTVDANGVPQGGAVWRTLLEPYIALQKTLESCPLEKTAFKNGNYYHYGMNPEPLRQILNVQKPTKRVVLSDTRSGQVRMTAPDSAGKSDISFRHRSFSNLLFLDGHIEMRKLEGVPGYPIRATTPYLEFWKM